MALSAFVKLSRKTLGDKGKGPQRLRALRDAVDNGKGLPAHDAPPAVLWEWAVSTLEAGGHLMSPAGARQWFREHDWNAETAQAMPSLAWVRAQLAKATKGKAEKPKATKAAPKATKAAPKATKPKATKPRKASKPS